MIEQAVIIASGRGVRLGTLITDRPKAMLPVLGKPIIVRIMDRMREAGIHRFIVVVGEQEGEAAAYLNNSWVPDAKVQIVLQTTPRGSDDALACATNYIDGPFLLAAPDHLTPPGHIATLLKRFQETDSDMTLSLRVAVEEGMANLPLVTVDGPRVIKISESGPRSRHAQVAFMLHACSRRVLNHLERPSHGVDRELTNLIQRLIAAGGKVNFVNAEWHSQLNTELDLLTINKRFLREGRDTHILSEIPGTVHITPPVRIDPKVSIGQGAKIGPNVYLESGAQVGQKAVVWDSVILRNAIIPDGEVLHGQIVTRRARISEPSSESSLPDPESGRS